MAGPDEVVVFSVPPALRQVVRGATGYRVSELPPGVHLGMPAASLTLIIDFSDGLLASEPGAFHVPTRDIVRRGALMAGLHTRATRVHHDGSQHGIELDLDPLAAQELLGLPVEELAHGCHSLDDVWPHAGSLRERLGSTDDWKLRGHIVFSALQKQVPAVPDPIPPEVVQAWRRIIAAHGQVRVDGVARMVGWSPRRLQQQFHLFLSTAPASTTASGPPSSRTIPMPCVAFSSLSASRKGLSCPHRAAH